jgi:hypothetical protein
MTSGTWSARARRAQERAVFGARVALDVLLVAIGCASAWLIALWSIGALVVYDSPAGDPVATSTGTPAPSASGALESQLSEVYAFDGLPRAIDGAVSCPHIELSEYAGTSVRFLPAAQVAAPFRERLAELERVVHETSLSFYGRAPSALLIAASYDCRPVTGNRKRLSEHALGNAIDITGFRFDADAATGEPAFDVRIDHHWNASGDALVERHARFLHALTQALIARNVFRTLLGPAHPDHKDHFHFDMAPQHYVEL